MLTRPNGYTRRGCGNGYGSADRAAQNMCPRRDSYAAGQRIPGTKTGTSIPGKNRDDEYDMRKELKALYFVMTELELYLDGHPNNCDALSRYECTVQEYKALSARYEEKYGPLLARNNGCTKEWRWVKEPWPWEV